MNLITRTFGASLLALALFTVPHADAGRIGGPASEFGIIQPGQTLAFNVPFSAGEASIAVYGEGLGNVDLYIYDGDGNVTEGAGVYERRVATVNVTRAGFFRVVLRNTGPVASSVYVGTN